MSRLAAHHAAQHVVRELDAAHVEPLLDAQQAPVHQLRERVRRRARGGQRLGHALLGQALAIAGLGEQFVLDHAPHARGLVGERALVEFASGSCRANRPAGRPRSPRGPARGARCSARGRRGSAATARPRHWPVPSRRRRSARSTRPPPATPGVPPGLTTALSACAPFMRASRIRFCVIEGMMPFTLSRCAR